MSDIVKFQNMLTRAGIPFLSDPSEDGTTRDVVVVFDEDDDGDEVGDPTTLTLSFNPVTGALIGASVEDDDGVIAEEEAADGPASPCDGCPDAATCPDKA